ncbi:MAG: MMPL family transporter [Oscillospiraceae bacterium]|nr:MMPL family transporter [Oscillospiraceae bacterium]
MKKTAAFIVRRRYMVLGIVVILTLLCTSLATKVEINSDMTKYLADDSSMKIGMDIMEEEFEDIEESQTIRVMAQGLDEAEKQTLLEALEALPYVSSVDHDESEDYNSGDYSLFVINTEYEYGSEEETAIEAALDEDFGDYDLTWQNDDDSAMSLKPWIIAVAVAFLLIVMLAMCESWIAPFLFLAAVGLAVLINAGTNIILGSVSNITNSIAAILQLVLSMDYSIILMNRYRQEQALCADKETAMTRALTHAFSSITSSSLTTIVGLLALVFMSFKIGRDLGLVLAKGVLISLLCIFTALPGMVLACDGLIKKTAKKTLSPPMGGLARFSYRFRYGLAAAFLVLFVGAYFAQQNTETAYTLESVDEIADIFPSESTLVLVYENQDEDAVALLAEELAENDSVTQVLGYPNLLGKEYTAPELLDAMDDLSDTFGMETDMDMDETMLGLIYYMYYDGDVGTLDMESFLTFLSEEVLEGDSFGDMIDEELSAQGEKLALFASSEELTRSMTVQELADFLDMDTDTVESLLLYYYTQHGGAETGSMTLKTFADFVVDEVAADPDYSELFDADTLSELE